MTDQNVRITNLPSIPDSGSKERVAFDLAARIASIEHPYGDKKPSEPRKYWLDLYSQCLDATKDRHVVK